ncbi:glutamine synthetase family protein [Pontivivens insulae]|uniref:Gamma-glutamylputrescine synthetase PuuA n=1 Tax=Pontivivens insulae TaxID=1639689 RepID=A0A2R8A8G4_9RHOB|nr:glutamine synthetase family protein [Pontivivens insulae]RED18615.1 glutamate--putrescine ligase [Pontivivens insulae]SPF28513.1 Gamma-glutamylputrescine synthetase PuuA [Pontivivens insulae]
MSLPTPESIATTLATGEYRSIELVYPDMNGVLRGKHVPLDQAGKLFGGVRLPRSTYNLDILSADVEAAGIAIDTGDPDGLGHCVAFGPAQWADHATALMTMTEVDGSPNPYDPRQALAGVVARFTERGLTPVVAPELEFYLMDAARDPGGRGQPPISPVTGDRLADPQIYRLSVQEPFLPILDAIREAANALGAAADVALAEFGPGQFEINLAHTPDPLNAADQAIMLKHAIRGVARANGMEACFMAKPYGDHSGSGLHYHISLLDETGTNIFAGDSDIPNAALGGAVARLVEVMGESTLGFAPHLNSYRRLAPGTYAPIIAAWGLDNRGVALRVPATQGVAARLEHRVPGSDANPYIALALILQGILEGLDATKDPGTPVVGEATTDHGEELPLGWGRALVAFQDSPFAARALGSEFHRVYALMKAQEMDSLRTRVTDVEFDVYMRSI